MLKKTTQQREKSHNTVNANLNSTTPHILVIDDNINMRAFLHSYLSEDYLITTCSNSRKGLVEIKKPTNLIIIDYDLEKSTGIDFVKQIKSNELYAEIPVIFLSESTESSVRINGLENGASDFLTKPFNPIELKARISNLTKDRTKAIQRELQPAFIAG
jgi:DNA-binding response OmpR family regulator